jgi:hypothetical protein
MDELGVLASRGQPVVVRQTLLGSNYGLVDDETLEPRPDYFASVLFKRLMGSVVLDLRSVGEADPFLRVYAHCTPDDAGKNAGSVTLLAISLHQDGPVTLRWPRASGRALDLYQVTASSLDSKQALLNGEPMAASDGVPTLGPRAGWFDGAITLPPESYTFLVIDAAAPTCPYPSHSARTMP